MEGEVLAFWRSVLLHRKLRASEPLHVLFPRSGMPFPPQHAGGPRVPLQCECPVCAPPCAVHQDGQSIPSVLMPPWNLVRSLLWAGDSGNSTPMLAKGDSLAFVTAKTRVWLGLGARRCHGLSECDPVPGCKKLRVQRTEQLRPVTTLCHRSGVSGGAGCLLCQGREAGSCCR